MKRLALLIAVAATVIPLLSACGEKETPEARLARLRSRHEIIPAGAATVSGLDGTPTLIVDVQVFNEGTEALDRLTILVRVRGRDGADRVAQRATLDLSGLQPGVGEPDAIAARRGARRGRRGSRVRGEPPVGELRSLF
jgi:hypothetical protein